MKEQGRRRSEWTNQKMSSSGGRGNQQNRTVGGKDKARDGSCRRHNLGLQLQARQAARGDRRTRGKGRGEHQVPAGSS